MSNEDKIGESATDSLNDASCSYQDPFYVSNSYSHLNGYDDSKNESAVISNVYISEDFNPDLQSDKIDKSCLSSEILFNESLPSFNNQDIVHPDTYSELVLHSKFKQGEIYLNSKRKYSENREDILYGYEGDKSPIDYSFMTHKDSKSMCNLSSKQLKKFVCRKTQKDFPHYNERLKIAKDLLNNEVSFEGRKELMEKNFWIIEDEPIETCVSSICETEDQNLDDDSTQIDRPLTSDQFLAHSEDNTNVKFDELCFLAGEIVTQKKKVSKSFMCHICGKMVRGRSGLRSHIHRHVALKIYQCQYCLKKFTQNSILKNHLRQHTGETPFSCFLCSNSFKTSAILQRHLVIHSVQHPFKCPKCPKTFKSKRYLDNHAETHLTKAVVCEVCDSKFSSRRALSSHKQMAHDRGDPFKCPICSKQYAFQRYLHQHMKMHTGEKKHVCRLCKVSYVWKSGLVAHMKTHSFKLKCEVCDDEFTSLKKLETHRSRHADPLPHVCSHCPKKFKFVSTLRTHEKTHKRDTKCDLCNETFRNKIKYKRHLKEHR